MAYTKNVYKIGPEQTNLIIALFTKYRKIALENLKN